MTADELQRLASNLRWLGLAVTAFGLVMTFGSHYIADKLFAAQSVDKAQAQARLKSEIGVDAIAINGKDIAAPGQVKVHVGAK